MSIKDNATTVGNPDVKTEINKETILEVVKLISATKPPVIQPYTVGLMGGVRIISSPYLKDDEIVVSDSIFSILQKISEDIPDANG